ncbi:MAG: signal peptidase I [Christensenellales bacterium]
MDTANNENNQENIQDNALNNKEKLEKHTENSFFEYDTDRAQADGASKEKADSDAHENEINQEQTGSADAQENSQTKDGDADAKNEKKQKKERKNKVWNEIFGWIGVICFALILATAVRGLLGEPVRVDGNSMNDTLLDGEIVIATKPKMLAGNLERGDVVICHYPNRNEKTWRIGSKLTLKVDTAFIKRLVALPGDAVAIIDGQLYINDSPVEEDFIVHKSMQSYPRRVLKSNEYFVMGDNRSNSHDSRSYDVGPITEDMIVGHAKWVIYPFNKIRGIN